MNHAGEILKQEKSSISLNGSTVLNFSFTHTPQMSGGCHFDTLLFMRFLCPDATAEWQVLTSAGTASWEGGGKQGDGERVRKTV